MRESRKKHALKKKYGLTPEQFGEMLASQGNACAICRTAFSDDNNPDIDHCHKTGAVRGLLCHPCNMGLGGFKDDPALLSAAAQWLIEVSQRAAQND